MNLNESTRTQRQYIFLPSVRREHGHIHPAAPQLEFSGTAVSPIVPHLIQHLQKKQTSSQLSKYLTLYQYISGRDVNSGDLLEEALQISVEGWSQNPLNKIVLQIFNIVRVPSSYENKEDFIRFAWVV